MHSAVGHEERQDDLTPRFPNRLDEPVEQVARPGAVRRVYERARDFRRNRRPWGPTRKTFYAFTLVAGLATIGAELIKHGHRELGEDFAVGAVLLLLLLICMVCARHFLAQELQ